MGTRSVTVFAGSRIVASGSPDSVVSVVRALESQADDRTVLLFDDETGEQTDLDLRADPPVEEPASRGPGRPKLGVVGREVTLLPRHWDWLNAQPGGASVALRKLVERARKEGAEGDRVRRSQEAAFRFMTAIAGNEPGYEEATRALYARDRETFEALVASWPPDVAEYARRLADDCLGQDVSSSSGAGRMI